MAQFWWSLTHSRVEEGPGDPNDQRLGPYDSREAAENWKASTAARSAAWEADDDTWAGRGR